MQPKMRRNLSGPFVTHELGKGVWRLSRSAPEPADVFVRSADFSSAVSLIPPHVGDIDIEWAEATVALSIKAAAHPGPVSLQSAVVHEPLPRLYEALPLAAFDVQARRFWRHVFRLVRVPGGRWLLAFAARRKRDAL